MLTALSIERGGLGRMGNTAFTIAGVIGIAVKSGQPYGFPKWLTTDNAIFGHPVDNIGDYLLSPLPPIPERSIFAPYDYFWGYRDVYLQGGNWSIDAHMQSEKFFKHCLPLIRKTFTFKDEPAQLDKVAVHIRFGDYIDDDNAHHPVCSKEYYQMAVKAFHPDQQYLIFSDGTREQIINKLPDINMTIVEMDYINSFALMKKCKSFICANSSFSLMAAVLGDHPDKQIICPSRWFGKGMPAEFDTKDIYPQNALII